MTGDRSATCPRPVRRRFAAVLMLLALPAGVGAQETPGAGGQSRALARAAQAAQAGRTEEARGILVELLESDPASAAGLVSLQQLLAARGRAGEVLPWAERAVARTGPDATIVRMVWIRALAAAGHADSAVAAATRWTEERSGTGAAHAALADALARAGRPEEAVEALRRGRRAAGDSTAHVQELAALLAAQARYEEAAAEWRTLLTWGDPGVAAVADRIRETGADRQRALEALAELLDRPETRFAVRRGGLALALRLGDRARAHELAAGLAGDAPRESRRVVLRDYYVETRNRDWLEEAEWAAERLEREATDEAERRHWRAMRADLAFLRGDTERAVPALEELAATAEPGTETHRRTIRRLFTARLDHDDVAAAALLAVYAEAYPEDTDERVDMAIELSRARVRGGDLEGAAGALGASGPVPADAALAARIEAQRGVLALLSGRPGLARSHLETAAFVPGGDPLRRTDALRLLDLLDQADSVEAARLGRGMLAVAARGDPALLGDAVEAWSRLPDGSEGPALAATAAAALERGGFGDEADRARRVLVDSWPDAPETPFALLELGRSEAMQGRVGEASRWLERLVVSFPDHALAPVARRELAGLAPDGAGSGGQGAP